MLNPLLILKHALKNEELRIDNEDDFFVIKYGKLKHISTDGIDNGILHLLKLVNHYIFDANIWSYNTLITNSLTLLYEGDLPSLQFFRDNNIKIMTLPTGTDYDNNQAILPAEYTYDKYEDIPFKEFGYIYRLRIKDKKIIVDGQLK